MANLTEARAALSADERCETVQLGAGGAGGCYALVDCRASLGAVLELRQEENSPCPRPTGQPARPAPPAVPTPSPAVGPPRPEAAAAAGLLDITLVNHQCLVTRDFNRTANAWSRIFGVAPPVGGLSPKAWQYYRGAPTNASVTLVKTPIGAASASRGTSRHNLPNVHSSC